MVSCGNSLCYPVAPSMHTQSCLTPRTVARHFPLSMGFPKQEHWSGLPSPSPGGAPDTGIKPSSPASPALAGGFFTTEPPGKPHRSTLDCR